MSRAQQFPTGIIKLEKLLTHLNAQPKLVLSGVKRLRLSLAFANAHFGARHFVAEDLPRIRYANPALDIEVRRVKKTAQEHWKPTIDLDLENGQTKTLDLSKKWSSAILQELMTVAGGDPWKAHVRECEINGTPVVPAPPADQSGVTPSKGDPSSSSKSTPTSAKSPGTATGTQQQKVVPTLDEFLATQPNTKPGAARIAEERLKAASKREKEARLKSKTKTKAGAKRGHAPKVPAAPLGAGFGVEPAPFPVTP